MADITLEQLAADLAFLRAALTVVEAKLTALERHDSEVAQHHDLLAELNARLDDTMHNVASLEALAVDLEVRARKLNARFEQRFGPERQTCVRCGRLMGAGGICQFGCNQAVQS